MQHPVALGQRLVDEKVTSLLTETGRLRTAVRKENVQDAHTLLLRIKHLNKNSNDQVTLPWKLGSNSLN